MDQQAGVDAAGFYGVDDLIEGNHDGFELRLEKAQGQVRGGAQAGHGDAAAGEFAALHGLGGDDDRAVAIAEAGAAIEQGVFVMQIGVGGEADRRDVVGFVVGGLVERFDVGEDVGELEPGRFHPVGGQRVEHEGVVGIGRMRQLDFHCFRGGLPGAHRASAPDRFIYLWCLRLACRDISPENASRIVEALLTRGGTSGQNQMLRGPRIAAEKISTLGHGQQTWEQPDAWRRWLRRASSQSALTMRAMAVSKSTAPSRYGCQKRSSAMS